MPNLSCGEAVMQLLSEYGVDTVFGMAGTMTVGAVSRHRTRRNPARAVSQRAGREPDGRRLRARDRKAGGMHHHRRAGRHQRRHWDCPGVLRLAAMLVLSARPRRVRTARAGAPFMSSMTKRRSPRASPPSARWCVYPEELPELIARAYAIFRGRAPAPGAPLIAARRPPRTGRRCVEDAARAAAANAASCGHRGGGGSSLPRAAGL